jgi:tRNA threonylcarbamoyladenosine biosynthesis protein TsaB
MATILSIETATSVCSVALAKDGRLLALREINAGFTHSENITVFISEACKEAQIALTEIDAIAVSKGPGSYTGLRIGASTAKGLCYALGKPLIAIGTLNSLAACSLTIPVSKLNTLLVPMLDARRMEVYCAVFDPALNEISPAAAVVVSENSFAGILKTNNVVFFGDGADKCKAVLGNNPNSVFADVNLSAAGMMALAENKFQEKDFDDVSLFEPFYLKEAMIGKQV